MTMTNRSLHNTEEETKTINQQERARNRCAHKLPFIAGRSHFTQKNAMFCAPASSPTRAPCNSHAAITMHFAASGGQPTATTHCRTQEETKKHQNERTRNRRAHKLPLIAGCGHFTRKNVFRAPASSSTKTLCNIHAGITMRFAASRG